MQMTLIAVGKLRESWAKSACQEYTMRLRQRFRFDLIEVRDEIQMVKHILPRTLVWMLDEGGDLWSSQELAKQIKKSQDQAVAGISFLIGGPDGFPASFQPSINATISLSRFTFPYQLARVIVLEQLYRASTILKGEPYHR